MLEITEAFNENDKLPTLEEAPDYTNLKPSLVMPILIPAPEIFGNLRKQTLKREQAQENHLPFRKRRQSLYFDFNSISANSEKFSESSSEVIKPTKKFTPRVKVTQEDFERVLNIGFCCHTKDNLSFKCYSEWCNFKTKSKDIFVKHIRDHHKTDIEFYKYSFCHLCQTSIKTKNLEEEF
ncbi:hypothetical protein ACKWTF_008047 [Chironomus riparius]